MADSLRTMYMCDKCNGRKRRHVIQAVSGAVDA